MLRQMPRQTTVPPVVELELRLVLVLVPVLVRALMLVLVLVLVPVRAVVLELVLGQVQVLELELMTLARAKVVSRQARRVAERQLRPRPQLLRIQPNAGVHPWRLPRPWHLQTLCTQLLTFSTPAACVACPASRRGGARRWAPLKAPRPGLNLGRWGA